MQITFVVISGDKLRNNFMHYADVFEPGKQLGEVHSITVEALETIDINHLIEATKEAFEKAGGNLIFLALSTIDGIRNTNYPIFFREGTQTVSNGNKYGLFRDILKGMGYQVETDQYMHVTSVKY